MKIEVVCDFCNQPFYKREQLIAKSKNNFCNVQCKRLFGSVETRCAHCLKVIRKQENQIRSTNFCSKECSIQWRQHNNFMKRRSVIVVYCGNCGNPIETTPYYTKTRKKQFCDKACFAQWKRNSTPSGTDSPFYNRIEIRCAFCSSLIYRTRSKIDNHKNQFCNKNCNNNWNKLNVKRGAENWKYNTVEKPCSYCGKLVKRQYWQANGYEHTFCNTECHGKWRSENMTGENSPLWQGGFIEYRGANWHKQRELARKRDNDTCQHCGITKNQIGRELDVHHIVPFRHFDDYRIANALDNLITLCGSCHMKAEPRKKAYST